MMWWGEYVNQKGLNPQLNGYLRKVFIWFSYKVKTTFLSYDSTIEFQPMQTTVTYVEK
jgi:hypothetical protein